MHVILTHQNADFDAIASMLGAFKVYPDALPVLPGRQNRNVVEFLALYRSALPFIPQKDLDSRAHITRITLTDTYKPIDLKGMKANVPTRIIDHHNMKRPLKPHETWDGDLIGAATTLLVERIQHKHIPITSLEATLLMLGIYEDTGMLTYGGTTTRDIRAAGWLLEQGAALDTVRRFLQHPLSDEQQPLFEMLLNHADTRDVNGYPITVSIADSAVYVAGINTVTHRLRTMLDSTALFSVVQLPDTVQLVCRSNHDAVNVGDVARLFGGGGHARAAAATIHDQTPQQIAAVIWSYVFENVQPAVRVADLMSFGVQTVAADEAVANVIHAIRRIGHEGYPVIDDDVVVGLLNRRDADRAAEHGLLNMTVGEIMQSGNITLKPDDSVFTLEQTMVESGWGQIPVVDEKQTLIGIVTRTDLIKHWANIHPATPTIQPGIAVDDIQAVLGDTVTQLIQTVAEYAQERQVTLYMVGGVVRDLLLQRPNYDIDFVVEGDAIQFAQALVAHSGGDMHSYRPFGTAKWLLNGDAAARLNLPADQLPHHIDFATARFEFYERPTALPTVYNSSIKLDLQRRDFTINTLAVQLSPVGAAWRILDIYGGLNDLRERLIRVLHSLSFVDDPTRILRAVRFSERLQFVVEPRTVELITTALPMLRQITGERLRNELTLLLRENQPERGFLKLQALGALPAIDPAFNVLPDIRDFFASVRQQSPEWAIDPVHEHDLYWHFIMGQIPPSEVASVGERLLFAYPVIRTFEDTARLVQTPGDIAEDDTPPSRIVDRLAPLREISLLAAWHMTRHTVVKSRLNRYIVEWRHLRPISNGHTLKTMGLPQGPRYRVILQALRDAWLDGVVQSAADEQQLLERLIGGDNTQADDPA